MRSAIGKTLFFLCLALPAPMARAGDFAEQSAVDLRVTPQTVRAGALYRGAKVSIDADIPMSDGAIIKIEGENEDIELNRKGKLGVIWLNVGRVKVKNAPQVYVLAASDVLTNICSQEKRMRLGLGFETLRGRLVFESEEQLKGSEFNEFLKLKEHSGAYSASRSVNLEQAAGGRQELSAVVSLPATIPPGEYGIHLYYFRGGDLMGEAETSLSIEKVGLPLLITGIAHEQPGLYGIMAIVVAMAAGVVIGLVFGSRRGRAH